MVVASLLDMLQSPSFDTQKHAARVLAALYRYVPAEPIQAWFQRADITSGEHSYMARRRFLYNKDRFSLRLLWYAEAMFLDQEHFSCPQDEGE